MRLSEGGLIDRDRTLRLRFDDRTIAAHPGDSLASALLANGIRLVGRSFKHHRPRGLLGAGAEEPCSDWRSARWSSWYRGC
ncbi:MAG: (2Fe-2S)-binding protein, partial [Pseudomonadota bacterium]